MARYIELTGQRFGKLTVLERAGGGGYHKPAKWRCVCDCGREKIVDSQLLRQGIITDCGCKITDRLVGKRFGRLTVIRDSGKRYQNNCGIIWECRCDCGNTTYVLTGNLTAKRNFTASCGCMKKERFTKHNLYKTKVYEKLNAIRGRCKNPNDRSYFRYGGRGITLCKEWDGPDGFQNFYDWAMSNGYKDGLTIDRIDNDKGYSPDNCRWVTQKVQMNNTRRNRYVVIDGEKHSVSEWARIKGICIGTVRDRLRRGWSEYDAIMKPLRHKQKKGQ